MIGKTMKNQWEVKWWRVGLALAIVFAVILATGFILDRYFGWHEIQDFCRENPNLADLPVPLSDKSVANLEGAQLQVQGLSFQVPWKEVLRQSDAKTISAVAFKDGPILSIPNRTNALETERLIQGYAKTKQEMDAARRSIGSPALSCCYDLMAGELAVTPSELKWWETWRTQRNTFLRLVRKSMDIMDSNAIYEINAGEMRGFQMGNPSVAPYEVKLELFDRDDRRHEITISQYGANRPFLTQAQVNAIVASIRTVPAT